MAESKCGESLYNIPDELGDEDEESDGFTNNDIAEKLYNRVHI